MKTLEEKIESGFYHGIESGMALFKKDLILELWPSPYAEKIVESAFSMWRDPSPWNLYAVATHLLCFAEEIETNCQ